MKKRAMLLLTLICALSAAGCQRVLSGPEIYSFPEPTLMITGTYLSQEQETDFAIGSEEFDPDDLSTLPVTQWFYRLKLTACERPEEAEVTGRYDFCVNGSSAFTYQTCGRNAYILFENACYKVKNPSPPPID